MQAEQRIRSTNKELADLLTKEIGNDERFERSYRAQELAYSSLFKSSKIVAPYKELTSFEWKLWGVSKTVKEFWRDKITSYKQALTELDGSLVYSSKSLEAQTLATFFDTVLYPVPLLGFPPQEYGNLDATWRRYGELVSMRGVLPILRADTDQPLIAFLEPFYPDEPIKAGLAPPHPELMAEVEPLFEAALGRISTPKIGMKSIKEWYEIAGRAIADKAIVDLSLLFNIEKFMTLLDQATSDMERDLERKYGRDLLSSGKKAYVLSWGKLFEFDKTRTKVPAEVFYQLLTLILSGFIDYVLSQKYSNAYLTDIAIPYQEFFSLCLELESQKTAQFAGLDAESAAARGLFFPEFSWVRAMCFEDVVRFREASGQEFLRDVFRTERKRLKFAPLEEFQATLKRIRKNLEEAVEEHEKMVRMQAQVSNREIGKAVLGFSATLALALISVMVPPCALISIPLAVWSAAVGGSSARTVINQVLTGKRQIAELRRRPIGIVAKYINRPQERH